MTPRDRLDKLDEVLNEYEKGLGLPAFIEGQEDTEVQRYLSLGPRDREKLTLEDCAEAALVLGNYAFYLQRALNRENARINWATAVLKEFISGRESQYTGSWESQFNQAVGEDSYTRKVLTIKRYAQQRADRVNYLSSSVKNIGDIFLSVQRSKAFKNG